MEIKDEKSEQTVLMRLLEYCKYLYEEEKDRTDHLNNAVKIYLAFFNYVGDFAMNNNLKSLIIKIQEKINLEKGESPETEERGKSTNDKNTPKDLKLQLEQLGLKRSEIENLLNELENSDRLELLQALLDRRSVKRDHIASTPIG